MALIALLSNLVFIALFIRQMWITRNARVTNPYTLTQSTLLMTGALLTQLIYIVAEPQTADGITGWEIAFCLFSAASSAAIGIHCHRRAERMMRR